jgi:hypothetical protein
VFGDSDDGRWRDMRRTYRIVDFQMSLQTRDDRTTKSLTWTWIVRIGSQRRRRGQREQLRKVRLSWSGHGGNDQWR